MSRFLPGREFKVIFEARQHATSLRERWQSLYRLVKSIQGNKPFANRKRVYKLACSLRDIVDQVTSTGFYGDFEVLQCLHLVNEHAAFKHSDTFFSDESRDFCYRSYAIPAGAIHVSISFVETYGQRYVPEIRFEPDSGSHSVLEHRHAAGEVLVAVGGGLAGFYLA